MRFLAVVALVCGLSLPVLAADAEGKITNVDPENLTITLENGETYKLPSEMDVSAIEPGMDVVVAYREIDGGVKQITDMLLPE